MTGLYKEHKFLLLSLLSPSFLPFCPSVFRLDQQHVNTGSVVEKHCHLVATSQNNPHLQHSATKLCCIFLALLSVKLKSTYNTLFVFPKVINILKSYAYIFY